MAGYYALIVAPPPLSTPPPHVEPPIPRPPFLKPLLHHTHVVPPILFPHLLLRPLEARDEVPAPQQVLGRLQLQHRAGQSVAVLQQKGAAPAGGRGAGRGE